MTDTTAPPAPPAPRHPVAPPDAGSRPSAVAALVGLLGIAAYFGGVDLLLVIAALVLMIFLHELGHYLAARRAGMKVTEFFIGFGPRIFSFRRGETEYGLKAIPAGAYVRVIGMNNLDEADPADEDRTYRQGSWFEKFRLDVAGSGMHFVQSLVLLFLLYAAVGVPGGVGLGKELPTPEREAWTVDEVAPGSAAEDAGIRLGDRIASIDGQEVGTFPAMAEVVYTLAGETVPIVVERDGGLGTLSATIGHLPDDTSVGRLGVGADRPIPPKVRLGVVDSAVETVRTFGTTAKLAVTGLGRILSPAGLSNFADQVAAGSKDPEPAPTTGGAGGSPSGEDQNQGEDRLLSLIGIGAIGTTALAQDGIAFGLLLLFSQINVFIGIFNLLPLPPFDGGRIAIGLYEKARSRRGKPYRADYGKVIPLAYAMIMFLVVIGVSSMYLDIVNPPV